MPLLLSNPPEGCDLAVMAVVGVPDITMYSGPELGTVKLEN